MRVHDNLNMVAKMVVANTLPDEELPYTDFPDLWPDEEMQYTDFLYQWRDEEV